MIYLSLLLNLHHKDNKRIMRMWIGVVTKNMIKTILKHIFQRWVAEQQMDTIRMASVSEKTEEEILLQ